MLLVNGERVPGTERVRENIVFKAGMPNTRKMKRPPLGLGLHWTGGENKSPIVIQTLKKRRLSIHVIGEPTGELVQTADLMTRCAHIGSPGNDRFAGIEMACRGFATKADLASALADDPTLRDRSELDWGEARDTYRDTIGGKEVGMASFAPLMIENMLFLTETLAGLFSWPRAIPWRKVVPTDKFLASIPLPDPELLLVEFDGAIWVPSFERDYDLASTHSGALGHYHVHPVKYDPGTQPLYALWAEGWNPAGKKIPRLMAGLL